MDDLISRKMVLALRRNKVRSLHTYEVIEETINVTDIEHLPSAESEIIHCRDCVHHIDGFFCRQANHHTSDNDCCASVFGAERKER